MNVYSISGIFILMTSLVLISIILRFYKTRLHQIWLLFNVAVGIYGFSCIWAGFARSEEIATFWFRIGQVGVILLPIFLFHSLCLLCAIKRPIQIFLIYVLGFVFVFLNLFSSDFVSGSELLFPNLYWLTVGRYFHPFFVFFALTVFYSLFELFRSFVRTRGNKRYQIGYFLFGMIVGFSGGLTNFLPLYGIVVYPWFNILISFYPIIVTYAIFRYNLMDIRLVFTRTGIFLFVYSLVLGIPFAIALTGRERLIDIMGATWWIVPLAVSTFLATGGPFIYLYLQGKAEEKLLYEQRRYQATLRQASAGMSRIKDLKRLLNLIVYILSRTVNLKHCTIYLYDPNNREYSLEALRGKQADKENNFIAEQSPVVRYLKKTGSPLVYEEVCQKIIDFDDENLRNIGVQMKLLEAEVIVPIATDKTLVAFGVLGRKKSEQMYTADDLAVFTILGNQVALAIENAQFYEESKTTQAQLFQAEKMATIGTMADGLSHQINNRLHALGFIAGDALDSIKLKSSDAKLAPAEIQDLLRDVVAALLKIQENVRQGGEIVQGLLRYTRKGEEGYGPVNFDKLIDASVEMAQFKIKKDQLAIIKDYPRNIPDLYGNFTQLQEVMFNIIDNAYDAVQQRKTETSEENYQGKIKVSARRIDEFLEINFLDNGMGIKDEDQMKLFTPFFTTKLSSKKGTGLGLYVVRKIIEENHHGRVFMTSEFGVGTLTVLKLPVVKKKE